jgi:hypothetical protein
LHELLQVMAFISPKIIGGITAPTPVGELGMVEMTQALQLSEVAFEQVVCLDNFSFLFFSFFLIFFGRVSCGTNPTSYSDKVKFTFFLLGNA